MELTVIEKTELEELETIINKNMGAFYEVGSALAQINKDRLYRETHDTFEAYCKDRWDMSRPRAYQLIESSNVMDALSTIVDIQPINESQTRPLTKLETAEAQQEAWDMVVETAPEGKITARHVSKIVSTIKKETTKKEVKKKAAKAKVINKEELIDEAFKRAFDAFYWEVQRARLEDWKNTSKETSLRLVILIQDLIEVK